MAVKSRPVVGETVCSLLSDRTARWIVSRESVGMHVGPWTRTLPMHSIPMVAGSRTLPRMSTPTGSRTLLSASRVISKLSKEAEFCISTDTLTCAPTPAAIGAGLDGQEVAPDGTMQTVH